MYINFYINNAKLILSFKCWSSCMYNVLTEIYLKSLKNQLQSRIINKIQTLQYILQMGALWPKQASYRGWLLPFTIFHTYQYNYTV